ncbi:cytosol aminopeptidase-like [Arctopsyche grandis]|uniref:cytosol aminopeptidase-like n=1 Tax=Arctopsyche grandis TaxID=121162 RepID=UPI00406D7765
MLCRAARLCLASPAPKPSSRLRHFSQNSPQKGLVLGAYTGKDDSVKLTETASNFNKKTEGKLLQHLSFGSPLKNGNARVFWGLSNEFPAVALVGLGSTDAAYDPIEEIDEARENIRIAAGVGCKALHSAGISHITVEELGGAQQAAEGSTLSLYSYQENKLVKNRKKIPELVLYAENKSSAQEWNTGVTAAKSQNFARDLMETPANLMTPTIFAETVANELEKLNVKITIRDQKWAEDKKMFSFLSVARGSDEPPKFLEIAYKSPDFKGDKPVVLVGKGVTFDTGGISIKPSAGMASMRGDMGGAACVVATFRAAAALNLPVNLVGLIPLTENMPGGRATKPGDVFVAMNGKSVLVDNTDAEGRLILADALCYSQTFDPAWVVDLATLTGAIRVSLGCAAAGVFTKHSVLWNAAQAAAVRSGDRLWRMPLWRYHTKRVTDYTNVDVHNVGKGKGGGSCTAAAFLAEFAPASVPWMHIDIAGVMEDSDDQPYIDKGMTGRPTRTLVELIQTKGI